jgi:hypothetical protein
MINEYKNLVIAVFGLQKKYNNYFHPLVLGYSRSHFQIGIILVFFNCFSWSYVIMSAFLFLNFFPASSSPLVSLCWFSSVKIFLFTERFLRNSFCWFLFFFNLIHFSHSSKKYRIVPVCSWYSCSIF